MNFLLAKYGKANAHAESGRGGWAFANSGGFQLDLATCVTAHKAQGGEFDSVCVYEEAAPNQQRELASGTVVYRPPNAAEHRKWLYTACSRAKKRLTLIAKPRPPKARERRRATT